MVNNGPTWSNVVNKTPIKNIEFVQFIPNNGLKGQTKNLVDRISGCICMYLFVCMCV